MCEPYQVYPSWFLDKLDMLQEPAKTEQKMKTKQEIQELEIIKNWITTKLTCNKHYSWDLWY